MNYMYWGKLTPYVFTNDVGKERRVDLRVVSALL